MTSTLTGSLKIQLVSPADSGSEYESRSEPYFFGGLVSDSETKSCEVQRTSKVEVEGGGEGAVSWKPASSRGPAGLQVVASGFKFIFSLSLLCSKMCSTGKPKERFLVAGTHARHAKSVAGRCTTGATCSE